MKKKQKHRHKYDQTERVVDMLMGFVESPYRVFTYNDLSVGKKRVMRTIQRDVFFLIKKKMIERVYVHNQLPVFRLDPVLRGILKSLYLSK